MFTGLVKGEGKIVKVENLGLHKRILVEIPFLENVKIGDSIALDGVCLTVEKIFNHTLQFFLSEETLKRTKFRRVLKTGMYVNVEPSLRIGDELGGHFVQGHVDTTGVIKGIARHTNSYVFIFSYPLQYQKYLVPKGSIAIDGISLTINEIRQAEFSVQVIPHTYQITNLKRRRIGDIVNIEFDMLGKYVIRFLELRRWS